jgi:hypothetical protein
MVEIALMDKLGRCGSTDSNVCELHGTRYSLVVPGLLIGSTAGL